MLEVNFTRFVCAIMFRLLLSRMLILFFFFCEGVRAVNCVICTVIQSFLVGSSGCLDSTREQTVHKYGENPHLSSLLMEEFSNRVRSWYVFFFILFFFCNHTQLECRIIAQCCDKTRSLILEQLLDTEKIKLGALLLAVV